MMGPRRRRSMRASARRALTTTTAGILLVSLGVLAGEGPAIGDQATATTLDYSCTFPSGPQQVQLVINATFPETGAAGNPIAPTNVSTKLDLPQIALGDLTTIGGVSLAAKVNLSVVVKHNGATQRVIWPLTAAKTRLPSTGDLTLAVTGTAPPIIEVGTGDVTFAADAFGLLLAPVTRTGAATKPPTVSAACTLDPKQTNTLATVTIPAMPGTSTSPSGTNTPNGPSGEPHDHATNSTGGPPLDPACNPDGKGLAFTGPPTAAQLLGRTNLRKIGESTALNGIVDLASNGSWVSADGQISMLCYTGQLHLQPSTTTVLGFGFVPITTTLTYVQINTPENPMFVEVSSKSTNGNLISSGHSTALVEIHVSSASVNGTPLNVGPNCRTETPVVIDVSSLPGRYKSGPKKGQAIYPYDGIRGGYLQGKLDIPQFTDCGVDENLDTLLSAPVSGPGNLSRVCQGPAQYLPNEPPDPPTADRCQAP